MASFIFALPVMGAAMFVSVKLGAMQFTRTFGASSAARERVSPSTAALALPMAACRAKPCRAATEENSTAAPRAAARAGAAACTQSAAPTTFKA